MRRQTIQALAVLALAALAAATPGQAAEAKKSYEFKLHEWHEIDAADGPVTLHRIRLDRVEGRLSKSAIARPHNQQYLQTVRIQLEYTNEASQKWQARITARWLDAEGQVIDGIGANESLGKKSARKVAQFSVSTLKYGLERAKTLEVQIHYEP